MKPFPMFAMFVLLSTAAADDTMSVAVCCPSGQASAQAFTDMAEAELSAQKGVRALERRGVDAVLREQELSLSGLVAPETALKAGKLLKVDLFILLEAAEEAETPFAVVIYDVKRGRRLIDAGLPRNTPEKVVAAVVADTLKAIGKMKGGPKDNVTLCVMPIRDVDLPKAEKYLPAAVGSLLQRALVRNPKITLLERSYLGELNKEADLPTEQKITAKDLLASAILVELEIARGTGKKSLRVRGALTGVSGARMADLAVNVNNAMPDAVIAALLPELKQKLRLAVESSEFAIDRKLEANRFLHEAGIARNRNARDVAMEAAEAAYALDDSEENAVELARCLLDKAFNLLAPDANPIFFLSFHPLYAKDRRQIAPKSPDDVDNAIEMGKRAVRIRSRFLPPDEQAEGKARDKAGNSMNDWGGFNRQFNSFAVVEKIAVATYSGKQHSHNELVDATRKYALSLPRQAELAFRASGSFYDFLSYCGIVRTTENDLLFAAGNDSRRLEGDITVLLNHFLEAYAENYENIYKAYDKEKGSHFTQNPDDCINQIFREVFADIYKKSQAGKLSPKSPYQEIVDACRRHPAAMLRIYVAGLDFLAQPLDKSRKDADLQEAVDRFFGACDKILDDADEQPLRKAKFAGDYLAIEQIVSKAANSSDDAQQKLLGLMIRRKEFVDLPVYNSLGCVESIEDKATRRDILKQLLAALQAPDALTHQLDPPQWGGVLGMVQARVQDLGKDMPQNEETALNKAWAARQVVIPPPERGYSMGGMALNSKGNVIYVACQKEDNRGEKAPFRLCQAWAKFGNPMVLAETAVARDSDEVAPMKGLYEGGYYCVASYGRGIFAYNLKTRQFKEFTKQTGLPSNGARSLAFLNGKLYAGLDSGEGSYFLEINLETGAYKTLSSSGSRDTASPFNNLAARVGIVAMRALPELNRIIMSVSLWEKDSYCYSLKGMENSDGLFEYDALTGKFTKISSLYALDVVKPYPFSGSYFIKGYGWAMMYAPTTRRGQLIHDNYWKTAMFALRKGKEQNITVPGWLLPAETGPMQPAALINDYLWTITPFGRVSLGTGKRELFPAALASCSHLEYAEILPTGDGKRVLVCGKPGVVLLDMETAPLHEQK